MKTMTDCQVFFTRAYGARKQWKASFIAQCKNCEITQQAEKVIIESQLGQGFMSASC